MTLQYYIHRIFINLIRNIKESPAIAAEWWLQYFQATSSVKLHNGIKGLLSRNEVFFYTYEINLKS